MVATSAGELLFDALDSGEMGTSNDVLDKHPESVGERDEELRVPLHYAADCADFGTFQRILGMDRTLMDAQDKFGFTPLLIAVMAGNLDVLQCLIEQGAQVGQLDREGHSAVHWAVVCGQLDTLMVLLPHGAPVALADIHGAHPLHYATVRLSLSSEDGQVPPERSEAILHVLLRQGAQLECTDFDGRTPLLWAASDGNLAAFRSLIQAGANRFAVDRDRLGVLHCAASHGHAEIVREMLALLAGRSGGWAVNAKDRNGDTPLFYCATFGHFECAKLLLERGANTNHLDKRNRTAAHCAAAKGQLRVLKLLRQFGASFNLQNYRGDLSFHEAIQTGIKEIFEWFLSIDPNFVSAPNFYGRTPLHLAAASGNMELVVLLCTRGAPVNALMLYKGELLSPLDVARRRGHGMVADYLAGRHGAMAAGEMSPRKRDQQRADIEDRLKSAKLRKIRADLLENEEIVEKDYEKTSKDGERGEGRMIRRGKSTMMLWTEGSREMVDSSTMVSRRSSSASSMFHAKNAKIPKSTSTTDLMNTFDGKIPPTTKQMSMRKEQEGKGRGMEEKTEKKEGGKGEGRREDVEKTIQRIVKVELKKASKREEAEGERRNKKRKEEEQRTAEGKGRERKDYETKTEQHQQLLVQNGANAKKVHLASEIDEEDGEEERRKTQRTRRRWTPRPERRRNEAEEEVEEGQREEEDGDEHVTELHVLQHGMSPLLPGSDPTPISRTSPSAPSSAVTRRFIHEKAIFDELTHLKRMQIQYGRVREQILVRSLVQNFCRMHAIHPSHFRRVSTFHQWEKFLYDQLKMIYVEERDRISAAVTAAAQRATAAAGAAGIQRAGTLYSARQRVFAGGSSTSGASLGRFEARVLARTNPLDERMHELNRIYGSASSSRNSAGASFSATRSTNAENDERMAMEGKKTEGRRERR